MFGIRMMGNVHTYAKQMQMETRWRQKQDSGDYSAKLEPATVEGERSVIEALTVEVPTEEAVADRNRMEEIRQKLKLGGSLTKEEVDFLKEKDPILYEEYVQAEEERKQAEQAYKEALKRCKTQEEVDRLQSTTVNRSMVRVKSIANNPHIEPEKKAIKIGAEKRKVDDVQRHTKEFVRKGEYRKLPTEAEVREAEKAEAEKQRAELGVDENEPVQSAEKTEAVESVRPEDATELADAEKPEAGRAKVELDIESDAERKVSRAKVKAAYAYASAQNDSSDDSGAGWSRRA